MHIRKDVQSCDSVYRTCRTDLPHCVERNFMAHEWQERIMWVCC